MKLIEILEEINELNIMPVKDPNGELGLLSRLNHGTDIERECMEHLLELGNRLQHIQGRLVSIKAIVDNDLPDNDIKTCLSEFIRCTLDVVDGGKGADVVKVVNHETLQAFRDTDERRNLTTHNSVDEMFHEILKDATDD